MPSLRIVVDLVVMEGGMGAVEVREGPSPINIESTPKSRVCLLQKKY